MKRFIYSVAMILMLQVANKGFSLESQQDEAFFLAACNAFLESPSSADGLPCSQYVHGFLAGARILDSAYIKHLEEEHNKPLSFSERAFRTRVGKPENTDLALPSAPFCLPDSEFNGDIINRLLSYLPGSIGSLDELDKKISESLAKEYPCA